MLKTTLRLHRVAASLAMFACASYASATGLVQAYTDALKNDPTFKSAIEDNKAGQENKALARSQLLPNLAANYYVGTNRADQTAPGLFGGISTTHPNYTSRSATLQLRQPILNLEITSRYFQAVAQVNYSNSVFNGRQQDLVNRVVSAYAEAQLAEEQLALYVAQRDAYAEQQASSQKLFERGESPRTDVLDAQAKYDGAQAQVLEAQDNVINLRNALSAITGTDIVELDRLSDKFKVRPLIPSRLEEWKDLALMKNAEIDALRNAVEVQRQETNKNRAGHAPKIDFIASLSKTESENLNTLNQDSKNRSIGVQVSIPLYSGGYVNASTRQAVANTEKARADLEAKTTQIMVEVRKQFSLAQSSIAKIDAFEKAERSADLALEATRQSIKGGVRVNLDLLNAQTQLFQAKRDLAQARFIYLLSYIRLRNAAGVLEGNDLQEIASYFTPGK